MTDHSTPPLLDRPNDSGSVNTGAIFYASKASLLSYFGIFGKISRRFITNFEGALPLHQTASTGLFPSRGPYMAIV